MLSSIRLVNVERIPLSLYCIGSLAMLLNFIECPINCDRCPWESNINRRSARLLHFDVQNVIDLANRYKTDVIFLHGAEPYMYVKHDMVRKIKDETTATVGIKVNPLIAKDFSGFETFIDSIDVVVFEVVSSRDVDIQVSLLSQMLCNSLIKSKHIEIVVVAECNRDLNGLLIEVASIVRGNNIPINVVFSSGEYSSLDVDKINRIRKEHPLVQAPVADMVELASTLCPGCRNIVVVRRSGIVYRVNVDELGRCRVCKYKLVNTKIKKPVKLPLDIPLA
ncbi:MAG: hypothetical protein QXJ56_04355 [Ignisphaera sp.]|uniref:Radical SAM protein n=1 Tax=Ignisphaera aggregans TaxID=334771 RepID=A0A7J3JQ71_9CREN